MDTNPSTINKLIGAEVASYKELNPEEAEKKAIQKDLEIKKDNNVNDDSLLKMENGNQSAEDNQSFYADLKPIPEKPKTSTNEDAKKDFKKKVDLHLNDNHYEDPSKSKKSMEDKRCDDAYSYLTIDEDFEDTYNEEDSYSLKGAAIGSAIGAAGMYGLGKIDDITAKRFLKNYPERKANLEKKINQKKKEGKSTIFLDSKLIELERMYKKAASLDDPRNRKAARNIRLATGAVIGGGLGYASGSKNFSDMDFYAAQENEGASSIFEKRNKYLGALDPLGATASHYTKDGKERTALINKAKNSKLNEAEKARLRKLNKIRTYGSVGNAVGAIGGPVGSLIAAKIARAEARGNREQHNKGRLNSYSDMDFYSAQENEGAGDPIGAKNLQHLTQAGMRALSGAPKKRWYKPEFVQKWQKKRHYGKIRQDVAKGTAGIVARHHGVDEGAARNIAGQAEKLVTPAVTKGASKTRAFFKKRFGSKN